MMRLVRCLSDLHLNKQGCVATIGNFDGLHLGHQAIIERVKAYAETLGVPSCVVIFEPQPLEYIAPDKTPIRLTRIREKLELLKQQAIDIVLCLPFNQHLKDLSASQFIEQILINGLHVKHIEVGDDFCFGAGRQGNFTRLLEAGQQFGFTVEDAKTVMLDGARISSTRVRNALAIGDLELVRRLLGREFSLSGKIIHGQRLARLLGFPTANVQIKRKLAPLQGVYVVSCVIQGSIHYGVANIGTRPTIQNDGKSHLEVHLLGFNGDIYNQHMSVTFHHKLRDEKKFNSLEELTAAINQDVTNARAYWQARDLLNC